MKFDLYAIDNAPEASKPLLETAQAKYNFVPNLLAIMAESPSLLNSYMTISEIYSGSSLNIVEQQVVLLTVSYENECHYCVAAHSIISQMSQVPNDVIEAIRDGISINDAKLEILRQFTKAIVTSCGWPSEIQVNAFLDAGYTRENIFDVVLGVGMKVLSNYTNHIAATPLDDAFAPASWRKVV